MQIIPYPSLSWAKQLSLLMRVQVGLYTMTDLQLDYVSRAFQ